MKAAEEAAARAETTGREQARWAHLVNAAFHLEETKNVSGALDSVLESFDSNLEPLEDFPGYAVRRFVLALKEALPAPR